MSEEETEEMKASILEEFIKNDGEIQVSYYLLSYNSHETLITLNLYKFLILKDFSKEPPGNFTYALFPNSLARSSAILRILHRRFHLQFIMQPRFRFNYNLFKVDSAWHGLLIIIIRLVTIKTMKQ